MAGASFCNWEIFSSRVIRETRSAARSSKLWLVSRYIGVPPVAGVAGVAGAAGDADAAGA
jgi:hypothetical protein